MEDDLSFLFPGDLKLAPLLVSPLAGWGAWVVVNAVHAGAGVLVHVFKLDDDLVSIVAACTIAAGWREGRKGDNKLDRQRRISRCVI